jgi:hypothetical protein
MPSPARSRSPLSRRLPPEVTRHLLQNFVEVPREALGREVLRAPQICHYYLAVKKEGKVLSLGLEAAEDLSSSQHATRNFEPKVHRGSPAGPWDRLCSTVPPWWKWMLFLGLLERLYTDAMREGIEVFKTSAQLSGQTLNGSYVLSVVDLFRDHDTTDWEVRFSEDHNEIFRETSSALSNQQVQRMLESFLGLIPKAEFSDCLLEIVAFRKPNMPDTISVLKGLKARHQEGYGIDNQGSGLMYPRPVSYICNVYLDYMGFKR